MRSVTFLSDFGSKDTYVAEVKAILCQSRKPAHIVDITHAIAAGDIQEGAYHLMRSYAYFAKGTVHLAVVDPGVGTDRACLYIKYDGHHFVGPDNGIFNWVIKDPKRAQVFQIPVAKTAAPTFHGRDVFAPFVVKLIDGKALGVKKWGKLAGLAFPNELQVIHIDTFGNCITSLPVEKNVTPRVTIGRRHRPVEVAENYAAIQKGDVALIKGSAGFWEIASNGDSAARLLSLARGHSLQLLL